MATSSAARLNPRNYGLDLLRIIAMVMVCSLHGNMFTGGPELPVGHSAFCWVTSLPHVPPYSAGCLHSFRLRISCTYAFYRKLEVE